MGLQQRRREQWLVNHVNQTNTSGGEGVGGLSHHLAITLQCIVQQELIHGLVSINNLINDGSLA